MEKDIREVIATKRIKGTSISLKKVELNNGDTDFRVYDGDELVMQDLDLNQSYREALRASGLLENV